MNSNAAICLPALPLDATAVGLVARPLRLRLVSIAPLETRPRDQDVEDIVQDLFVDMLERRLDPGHDVAAALDRLIAHVRRRARSAALRTCATGRKK